jgi:hypothetical protein
LIAGVFAGCSFLAKTTALYFVGGVFLFFLFSEQLDSASTSSPQKSRSPVYSAFIFVSVLLFQACVALLIREHGDAGEILDLVLPPCALAMLILLKERQSGRKLGGERFLSLFRMTLPFGLGFLIPLALFAIPYLRGNGVHALFVGVFVLPFKRVSGAHFSSPEIVKSLPALVLVAVLFLSARLRGIARWLTILLVAIFAAYSLSSSSREWISYQRMWHAAYWLTPFLVLAGVLFLYLNRHVTENSTDAIKQQQSFLILATLALCALVQYPFSAPIYFCYVAPLVILAAVAVFRFLPSAPAPLLVVVYASFLLFGALRVTPPFIRFMGYQYQPDPETRVLDLPRVGGLRVDRESVEIYQKLIPLVQEHAGSGEIYAAPDCPEVYFLARHKNPTRYLFDFFDNDSRNLDHIVQVVDGHSVRVVVINRQPPFSDPLPFDVYQALLARFPHSGKIENFEVRWRE